MVTATVAEWIRVAPDEVLERKLKEYDHYASAKPRDQDYLIALRSAITAELARRV